ncbi:CaiB/BaiF CoA transferase family protein [Thermodesulfobacteriota bacterium]
MIQKQIFDGINVVEFAAFAAGPGIGKHFGDHGATVIHVESMARPDGFRSNYPPFPDNKPGINRSGVFDLCNNNKLGITVNLKAPGGIETAKKLAKWADVVIENFAPGVMDKLGLGYEALKFVREDIIMLSTCNQGQTGPHARHRGFGSHLTSLSGFTNLTGYPDGIPCMLYGPYIDFIGVGFGMIALASALDYRHRTGKGQYFDLSQYENGAQFIAPTLLDYEINGKIMQRRGNRETYLCPHGVFPCSGDDEWCAISIHSDDEWQVLCSLMGNPEWSQDKKFQTVLGRKTHEDELDSLLGEWTVTMEPMALMERLQSAGLNAGAVKKMKDLYTDVQLKHRHQWWEMEHPEMGRHHYEGPPFLFSDTPSNLNKPSPCIGEHNELVFKEILEFSEAEYNQLIHDGVIDKV